ncbi:MAG: 50S ribosomal protein L16 [Rickettsiales bacterium]|jgi:large subunit ribosomal protein L16|nr:50S ribosomal protein L16 [Rickettsiales bacterium]
MLLPKKTKHRNFQKGGKLIGGFADAGSTLVFGTFGLKSLSAGRLRSNQIEAARRCITRTMKRSGKMWIRVFPHIPVTGKALGVRMGGGKGSISYWMCRVRPGLVLFELDGVEYGVSVEALEKASNKLPFKTKVVKLV